jgi:hypothetical protein
LRNVANAHQGTDLLLISHWLTDESLSLAWPFVPRMLHAASQVLREVMDADGRRYFKPIPRRSIDELAKTKPIRRAA